MLGNTPPIVNEIRLVSKVEAAALGAICVLYNTRKEREREMERAVSDTEKPPHLSTGINNQDTASPVSFN